MTRSRLALSALSPAITIAALLLSGAPAFADDESTALLKDEPRIIVASPKDEAIRHLSWPKIVRAKNGNLIVGYSAGIGHNKGASGLGISLSTDGGQTFSPPHLLCYFPRDDDRYQDLGNLAMGVDEQDGTIHLLAMAYRGDEANTILGWRSLDHGETWQRTDTAALGENRTGSIFGHVFAVPGKGLAVCGHFRPPAGYGLWMAYSTDSGQSWGPPETISDRKYFEPTFIHTAGKLVGFGRENAAHAYHQLVSEDTGKTWKLTESALQSHPKAVHPSPFLVADPNDPKRILALVSERDPVHQITLWEAGANTLEWRRVGLLVTGEGDWTYPWMTHLGGNEWFLVYYQGTKIASSIYGARFSVP